MSSRLPVILGLISVVLTAALTTTPARGATLDQKCVIAKLKAAGKRTAAKLSCHQKAVAKGVAVDPVCVLKADLAFQKALAKAEKKAACGGLDDDIAQRADGCVSDLVAAVPTATPTPAPVPTPTEPPNLAGITAAHNAVRANLGIGPLVWSAPLAATAQAWANQCVDLAAPSGFLDNNPNRSVGHPAYVGENIFGSSGTVIASEAVSLWAAQVADYDYATDTCAMNEVCSDYTQVVWAASLEVGCAISACPGLAFGNSLVCNYLPGGNTGGRPY